VDDGERSAERPAVLEYGRPPPSRMASVFTRVGIFFGLGVVFFGFAILGGYLGHVVSPRPRFHYGTEIKLPAFTTSQNSPALQRALDRMRDPQTAAGALRAQNLDRGESAEQLYSRMTLRAPTSQFEASEIRIEFEDVDERTAALGGIMLMWEFDKILKAQGQPHEIDVLGLRWRGALRRESPWEFWLIGAGVLIGLLIPAIGLRMLWKPFLRMAQSAALSEAVWTQSPR
jgi:hypothetical protein